MVVEIIEVRAGDILTLDRLNRAFSAWLDGKPFSLPLRVAFFS